MRLLGQFQTLYFFITKRFRTHQKVPKSTKKHKKHQKHKNATKQKNKTQISEQKLKIRLKTSKGKKVTYSLICIFVFFCAHREKKTENKKKKKSLYNVMY